MATDADADRALVARQLGREPRAFRRVAVRCPFGAPAVTEQQPYTVGGDPFPTTYYLTCRHLVAAVSRLEAAGGVERWSAAARDEPELAASLAEADDDQRRIRRELADGPPAEGRGTAVRIPAASPPEFADSERSDGGASLELGVGGSRQSPGLGSGSLKCLHAHVAYALARPGYELGERIAAEVEPLWPDHCCSAADA
jgi:hypothetical protein